MHSLSHRKPPLAARAIGLMSLIRRRASSVRLMGARFRPLLVRSGICHHLGQRFPPLEIDRQSRKAAHQMLDQQSHRQGQLPVLGQDQASDSTASSPATGPTHPLRERMPPFDRCLPLFRLD